MKVWLTISLLFRLFSKLQRLEKYKIVQGVAIKSKIIFFAEAK